jgi:hypothetical protein
MPGVVTVACKVPNGLILRLFKMVDFEEPVIGGGIRTSKRGQPDMSKPPVLVNGPGGIGFGHAPKCQIADGYGLTPNVDADFFAEWMRQNADLDAVKNRMIFAHEKQDTITKMARDNEKRRSGMEPIEPGSDPRRPKSPLRQVGNIETGAAV